MTFFPNSKWCLPVAVFYTLYKVIRISRRAVTYHLDGLSFREYVQIQTGELFEPFSLEELLKNHVAIAEAILEKIKPFVHFQPYLGHGFYPYFLQGTNTYSTKLMGTFIQMIDLIFLICVGLNPVHKLTETIVASVGSVGSL